MAIKRIDYRAAVRKLCPDALDWAAGRDGGLSVITPQGAHRHYTLAQVERALRPRKRKPSKAEADPGAQSESPVEEPHKHKVSRPEEEQQ